MRLFFACKLVFTLKKSAIVKQICLYATAKEHIIGSYERGVFMAFVGFWMIPLALAVYALDRFFAIFGFDFLEWLGNPQTIDRLLGYLEKIIGFISAAWNVAEPYVEPVLNFIEKFI